MIDEKTPRRYKCRACEATSPNIKWEDWLRGETWVLFCPRCKAWDTEEIEPLLVLDRDFWALLMITLFVTYLCLR